MDRFERREFIRRLSLAPAALGAAAHAIGETKPPPRVRFGLIADIHPDVMPDGIERVRAFVAAMQRAKVDFILQLGDFCWPAPRNRPFLEAWNQFPGPRFHVLGNHDMDDRTDCADLECRAQSHARKVSRPAKAFLSPRFGRSWRSRDSGQFETDSGAFDSPRKHLPKATHTRSQQQPHSTLVLRSPSGYKSRCPSPMKPDDAIELEFDHLVLRYCRQIIMQAMDHVRSTMRGQRRLQLKCCVADPRVRKSEQNLTKGIDREAEDLILNALRCKFAKLPGDKSYTVFSEELGIRTFPEGGSETTADLVVFIDPIDGTEFIETLQGGWSLIAVYDRQTDEVIAAVAGDIFLDRLYWASKNGYSEGLDFVTHSWFRLDGGVEPKTSLAGARVNVLTTKVERYRALSAQTALLDAIREADGRINLSWGSNTILQVAAGYADVAIEFAKGFATYDLLPGLYIGLKAGLTILDLSGKPLTSRLEIDDIFATYRRDPQHPRRTPFIAAKEPALAEQVLTLLRRQ